MYGKLSIPLNMTGNFETDVQSSYEYFQKNIYGSNKRLVLFDKEVFIEAREKIDEIPSGFWHAISLEETHRFRVLPCTNDGNINLCHQNCNCGRKQVVIKYGAETRNICLLRASRLPWIVDIINLANKDDPSVVVWKKPSKDKRSDKLYLRYNHSGADFILIFSVERYYFRLISSFPVFYLSDKEKFDKDAASYAWSYFRTK